MPAPEYTTKPDDQPELGDIKINHNVIAGIVRLAALEVNGVAGVGGGLVDGIGELFSKREADSRGVKISETANGSYAIEIRLSVVFGTEIGRTSYEVQIAVRKQVLGMTGKDVSRVDVIIEGVRLPVSPRNPSDKPEELWPEIPATD
ncbi:MAG: Asp23/Gls24 family envelope stress response protein [Opitutae bacterium]|nr:Asp23/Gls24 family envelope stress response protein [Opitutae bacterium]